MLQEILQFDNRFADLRVEKFGCSTVEVFFVRFMVVLFQRPQVPYQSFFVLDDAFFKTLNFSRIEITIFYVCQQLLILIFALSCSFNVVALFETTKQHLQI